MIIGLTGLAGSGKSEVAYALRNVAKTTTIPFAGPLKSMLKAVGFTDAQLYGDEKSVPLPQFGGRTPRQMMQWLGTEWGRELVDDQIWITLWKKAVSEAKTPLVIADDVRFPNELNAIREMGGVVWRIERPGVVAMGHESEVHIPRMRVDAVIHNTSTLFELRQEADYHLHALVTADAG